MNKNITDIRCVNDDYLLCKNSKGNYCITNFDYNDLFDSNVSVLNDDICSVSKGGNYFAVARNKNITVIDTNIHTIQTSRRCFLLLKFCLYHHKYNLKSQSKSRRKCKFSGFLH